MRSCSGSWSGSTGALRTSVTGVLDVTSKEDESRIRRNNAAQNVALLRKIALDLLKADKTIKDTVRGKRLQATFSETILSRFLRIDYSK